MVKLPVPYRSQWDPTDAGNHSTDCGPTSVAMILNYRGVPMTPNGVYAHIAEAKGPNDFPIFTELILAARAVGVKLNWRKYNEEGREAAFRALRANLDAGNPAIALVHYHPWRQSLGNQFSGGHFVVVTGYDDQHVYIHDPLFGLWVTPGEKGAHYAMPNDLFAAGWGSASADGNWDYSLAYNGDVVDPAPPAPQPQPVPTPPPTPPPVVTPPPPPPTPPPVVTPTPPPVVTPPAPPPPPPGGKRMEDIDRRIRTLAAYRWATPPDPNNAEEMKLWLENIGDFALEYDEYVVRSGDSLSALAGRTYGEAHRWPAIKIYNQLQRDGLWVGETVLIPRLGNSGAHLNPALPHDTTDPSKDINFGALIDPGLEALNYDELAGGASQGIGDVDLPDA